MALQALRIGEELSAPTYQQFGGFGGGGGVDPNLLRLLAERRRKQGLTGPAFTPPPQAPQAAPGIAPQAAPMNPQLRAALLLRQRRRQQFSQQQAPTYGQVMPRRV